MVEMAAHIIKHIRLKANAVLTSQVADDKMGRVIPKDAMEEWSGFQVSQRQ
jgi:hypothetical protein